jgi:Domain of unknown function (DUF6259)
MNRRNFLRVTVPTSFGLAKGFPIHTAAASTDVWTIENNHLKIALSGATKGGLREFTDLLSHRSFIAKELPLYRLFLIQNGTDLLELSSMDAEDVKIDRASSDHRETLTMTYGSHRALDIRVLCSVTLEADSPVSAWRFSVQNNSPHGIRAIHYPVVVSPASLGGEDAYFISGTGGGARITNPGKNKPAARRRSGTGSEYPHSVALQLQAYYDATGGLYMATHDSGINVKHFGVTRVPDGLDVSIEHNYDERAGLSFALPYDTVLGVFHGEWHSAADIYKRWAEKQYWCAKKRHERDDLPKWLNEPRPVLECECRGDYQRVHGWMPFPPCDYPNGRFWPAKKVLPLSRKYSSLFDTPVVVWYNGWEKYGNPAGPVDTLPPLEGAESLKAAMDELVADGSIPYMAVWGNHWIYKRSSGGYYGWERFQREGAPLAALDEHGNIVKNGGAEYTWVNLCQGSEEMQQLFVKYFGELMNLGGVALELDHQSMPSHCYSDQHGHAPGFGAWMGQRTTDFLSKIRQMAKSRNPNATLSVEGTAEAYIQVLDLMLDRPYFPGMIPLFTYVYHEYIPLLGGDGRYGIACPEEQLITHAANFVYGHMKFVTVGDNGYDFEVNPNYPIFTLLRNLCQAERTYARDYLVYGRMLAPTPLQCSKVTFDGHIPLIKPLEDLPDPPQVDVPKVMHGVWQSPRNKVGYVLVNWSAETDKVRMGLRNQDNPVLLTSGSDKRVVPQEEVRSAQISITVPARSVVLVEQG